MPKGRPLTYDAKNNKQYFVDYYHKTQEDIVCECGCSIRRSDISKHKKTKKHIKLMNQLNNNTNNEVVV